MSEIFYEYHQNILSWQSTFKRIPKASMYASFLFFLIGLSGFVVSILFFPEKASAMWILLIMAIASGAWFLFTNLKVVRMVKIFKDLNILKDFETFRDVIKSIIEIRKDVSIKDKTSAVEQLFRQNEIKSKDLHLELNRIAIDVQRIQAREK